MEASMNTSMYEPLEGMVAELIRCGLPADYARRAAAELADHHRDLVEELRAAGWTDSHAVSEASRRLGEPRKLVKNTVSEYQRRFWCGRWPLITFLLGPIPVLLVTWFSTGSALWLVIGLLTKFGLTSYADVDRAFIGVPVALKYAVLIGLFLVIPAAVMYLFARLAKRAALGWQWIVLVACIIGVFMGAWKWERIGPHSRVTMYDSETLQPIEQPPAPDFVLTLWLPINAQSLTWPELHRVFLSNPVQPCQILLPAAIACLFLLRSRQRSHRQQRTVTAIW
jgi:hypothetical protein